MSSRIRLLDQETAAKIAAGEVVERPSSVVKELVENAIDAGATRIEVEIKNGGKTLIRVTDNGMGMNREELQLAVERHATSKLAAVEDLNTLKTLGFRGEALPSIAAVTTLEIKSRPRGAETGHILELAGGKIKRLREAGMPEGTTVIAADLFANVPARLKYLKSIPTEAGYIADLVGRLAIAHAGISFRLVHHEYEIIFTTGSGDRYEALTAVFGREIAREIIPIEESPGPIEVTGFVGKPSIARASRNYELTFLNDRFIRSRVVGAAVEKAYHSLLPIARYPFAVVFLRLDPAAFDVNIHPAKLEVRFADEGAVFKAVLGSVRRTLAAASLLHDWRMEDERASSSVPRPAPAPAPPGRDAFKPVKAALPLLQEQLDEGREEHRFISLGLALQETYLLAKDTEGLLLVDQHAAHERVLYDSYRRAQQRALAPQRLLIPATIELPAPQARLLAERREIFAGLGLQIEEFGPNSFILRTMPASLCKMDGARLVVDLLDELLHQPVPRTPAAIADMLMVAMACRAAIKAGDNLTPPEMQALLDDLAAVETPYTCPHGRPTVVRLSWAEINRRFKRKQG